MLQLFPQCRIWVHLIGIGSNYKFGMVEEGQLFDEAKNKARELLEKLGTIEEQLIAAVRT
jgi:hypothetical protein